MKSTGEVMGLDRDFGRAFAKSQLGAGVVLPLQGTVFISVQGPRQGRAWSSSRASSTSWAFELVATRGTAARSARPGVAVRRVNKVLEGRPHIVDAMRQRRHAAGFQHDRGRAGDGRQLQPAPHRADQQQFRYYTTVAGARAAVEAIAALQSGNLEVAPLQSYFAGRLRDRQGLARRG